MTSIEPVNEADASPDRAAPDCEVAIIGAGLGGIGMAIALRRMGIDDFVVLERASDIGGTWRDNRYPGLTVDIPAQAYQFSYELKPDWSRVFATGAEVKAYIEQCADRYDVRRFIRLRSEVRSRTWDEHAKLWRLELPTGRLSARFVISAIGAFVNPVQPAIDGLDTFTGSVVRSAAWDASVPLEGKRIAVIGTGASAIQIVPEIAPSAAQLCVFQRTPIWVGPKLDWRTPRFVHRLFRRFPALQQAVRTTLTRVVEAGLVGLVVQHDRFGWITRAGGWLGRNVWYPLQVRDRDVRRRLLPDYEIGCKRPSVSNSYLSTFNHPNVELVSDRIERVTIYNNKTKQQETLPMDCVIPQLGFVSSLGAIAEWGLEIAKNDIKVSQMMETNLPGIFAAGDIVTYPGKLKLIATGAGEACIAVNHAVHFIHPEAKVMPGHSSNMAIFGQTDD